MRWIDKLFSKGNIINLEEMIFDKYNGTLLQVNKSKSGKCCIPEGIQFIQEKALADCVLLSEVCLPNSILQIQSYAFKGCTSLKSVNIPPKVHYLNQGTFEDCVNLKELHMQCTTPPICINNTTNHFFSNSEMQLYVNHSKLQEGNSCFIGVDMEQCTLYIPKGTYEIYSQTNIWRLFKTIKQTESS